MASLLKGRSYFQMDHSGLEYSNGYSCDAFNIITFYDNECTILPLFFLTLFYFSLLNFLFFLLFIIYFNIRTQLFSKKCSFLGLLATTSGNKCECPRAFTNHHDLISSK